MTLLDFIQRLLGLQAPSASTARQRLQLVLAHDRSDLNPELLEQMRREILEVVQRYVEIDLDAGDVNLATEDQVTALVANLPIKRALPRPLLADGAGAGGPNGKTRTATAQEEGDHPCGAGEASEAPQTPDAEEAGKDRPDRDVSAAPVTPAGDTPTPGGI